MRLFLDSPPDQWHTFTMSGNQSHLEPDAFSQRRLMVALGLQRVAWHERQF
jgi:hypothetical protein